MRSGKKILHLASAGYRELRAVSTSTSTSKAARLPHSDGLAPLAGAPGLLPWSGENSQASFPEMRWKRSAAKLSMISIAFRRLSAVEDCENDIHEREPGYAGGCGMEGLEQL